MAGMDAAGTLSMDSNGFSVARYRDWENAKYGENSVRLFSKLHVIRALHGGICAATVSPGNANDSPYLREMAAFLPHGSGDLLADSAYGCKKNCNAVRDTGRRPVMQPKSSYVIKGFNARADMLKFYEERPGIFHRILSMRNSVEGVFSAIKDRFGAVIRALRERTQSVELPSMVVCYNMAVA